jgi:heptosyltransferase-3
MNILFITSTRIGDAVISTVLLNHLIKTYPHSQITIACGPLPSALFEDLPNLKKIIIMTKKKYANHWFKLWSHVVREKWDLAVDLRGSAITYFLPTRQRIIWRALTASTKKRSQQLLDLAGIQEQVFPKIWVSSQRIKKLNGLIPCNAPTVALAPAANWPSKEWPQSHFLDLIAQLTHKNGCLPEARIAIFAAPHEYERLRPLIEHLQDQLIDVSPYHHLLDVATLLQQCVAFIGNDSGLMHMAAAQGIPTLGLFGPSNELLYAPTGPRAAFIRTPESFAALWEKVKANTTSGLMDSLTVDAVAAKFREILQENKDSPMA